MKNITFIIPYQRDSPDRLNNLKYLLKYLVYTVGVYHVTISCTPKEKNDININLYTDINLKIITTDIKHQNHKTKLINEAIRVAKTTYICVNDVDVLTPKENYIESICELENGFHYVLPFEVTMYSIPNYYKDKIKDSDFHENYPILYKKSIGGIYFAHRFRFLSIGAENELMIGWGWEDFERNERARRLFLKTKYLNYNLWHIEHKRKELTPNQKELTQINLNIYNKLFKLKYSDLIEYIQTWL